MNDTPPAKHKIIFDRTINLGHILTFVGFIVAGFGAWATLDKRLIIIEEGRAHQKQVDINQDQRGLDALNTVKETLVRLDRQMDRIADKLDKAKPER